MATGPGDSPSKDEILAGLEDCIQCRLCGRWLQSLNGHLERIHAITADEYKQRFGVAKVMCEKVRYQAGLRVVGYGWGEKAWTDEDLLAAIRAVYEAGESLRPPTLRAGHEVLVKMAERRFGSLERALERTQIPYEEVRRRGGYERWTREVVLAEIRYRAQAGVSLQRDDAIHSHAALFHRAEHYFKTWDKGVRAAGCDPAASVAPVADASAWTRERVLAELGDRLEADPTLNAGKVLRQDPAFYRCARRLLGPLRPHLALLRKPPRRPTGGERKQEQWTDPLVLTRLRELAAQGESLRPTDMRKTGRTHIMEQARRRFGSYREGLRSAGLDPDRHIDHPARYSEEEVLARLQRRLDAGESIEFSDLKRDDLKLCQLACKKFRSIKQAAARLGIDYDAYRRERGKSRWTDEYVLECLREDLAAGLSMEWKDVKQRRPSLFHAAHSRFPGGWAKIMEAARGSGAEPSHP